MNIFSEIRYFLMRIAIKTVGQTSNGISMVTELGLTSGIMLDYIYRNKPEGRFIIGPWLDRIFLSHQAWEDVRIRKHNLEKYLAESIGLQKGISRDPVIMDVAAGLAGYLIDTLSGNDADQIKTVCLDLDPQVQVQGKEKAAEKGVSGMQFIQGDAFSREGLASVNPGANIIVSSGFYDWITDDARVKESMSIIYELLPDDGNFVFTNQSRHVNLEFVQKVFSSHTGAALNMTLRPADKVNTWAEEAGFTILKTTGDVTTNYSVTLAKK